MASPPLALVGAYGPYVLNGGVQTFGPQGSMIDSGRFNSYRLLVIEDGALRLDQPGKPAERLSPGEACLLVPGSPVCARVAPHSALRFVVFDLIHCPREGSPGRLVHRPPVQRQPEPERVWGVSLPCRLSPVMSTAAGELCQLIRGEYWRGIAEHARAGARLGLWLADLVVGLRVESEEVESSDLFIAAERHVRHQSPRLPSVADLAAWCGMSREHFSRSFKRARGLTPSAFLDNERWQLARRLLIDSDDSIEKIARHLGYRQLPAFSRAFRRRFGSAPREYRRRHRRMRSGSANGGTGHAPPMDEAADGAVQP